MSRTSHPSALSLLPLASLPAGQDDDDGFHPNSVAGRLVLARRAELARLHRARVERWIAAVGLPTVPAGTITTGRGKARRTVPAVKIDAAACFATYHAALAAGRV